MENGLNKPEKKGLRLVAIGGGTGLATLLSGLKLFVGAEEPESVRIEDLAAVVAVSDDGGSSGRLRDELKMPPPGDIRNCMVALSEDSHLLSKLFRHRFESDGELGGHSFGNLFLAALSEITGDFPEAVRLSSEILVSKGHIYPATTDDVRLVGELEDGAEILGESNIGSSVKRISKVRIVPEDSVPFPAAVEAIEAADLITVGPGSLFTSILPPLLVGGIAEAIRNSNATKIFVSNLMTQPGETEGFTALAHLQVLLDHVPGLAFDAVVVNGEKIEADQAERYGGEGAEQIGLGHSITPAGLEGTVVVYDNLLDKGKKVRHHPEKLSRAILRCISDPPFNTPEASHLSD